MSKKNSIAKSNVLLVSLLVVFVVLAVLLVSVLVSDNGGKNDNNSSDSQNSSSLQEQVSSGIVSSSETQSSSEISSGANSSSSKIEASGNYPEPESESEDWYLKLVNNENPLGGEFNPTTATIKAEFNPSGLKFDARAVEALNMMLTDAKKAGYKITIGSAYRSVARQTTLYNNKVNYYKNQGYDEEKAKTVAATVVAIPGTSEHNLGLAVDFYPIDNSFENSGQYSWLMKNCTKYGFVLRYPKDKQDITKIIYEPWHYRYVGVKAAEEMQAKDMCLEEYTEYLKTK